MFSDADDAEEAPKVPGLAFMGKAVVNEHKLTNMKHFGLKSFSSGQEDREAAATAATRDAFKVLPRRSRHPHNVVLVRTSVLFPVCLWARSCTDESILLLPGRSVEIHWICPAGVLGFDIRNLRQGQ